MSNCSIIDREIERYSRICHDPMLTSLSLSTQNANKNNKLPTFTSLYLSNTCELEGPENLAKYPTMYVLHSLLRFSELR